MTNVVKNLEDLGKVVGNIDTSVLVGQLSSMIGKQVDWVETINEADAEGNPTSREETFKGTVTGVTIVEGTPRIVVEAADGEKHIVEIANIGHVYESTPEDNSSAQTQGNVADSNVATAVEETEAAVPVNTVKDVLAENNSEQVATNLDAAEVVE